MKNLVPGFWYLKNLRNKKYKIFETNIYNINKHQKRISIIETAYKKFLHELSIELNKIHGIDWRVLEWEVVIGPWLNRYLSILLDRLYILGLKFVFSLKNFKKSTT